MWRDQASMADVRATMAIARPHEMKRPVWRPATELSGCERSEEGDTEDATRLPGGVEGARGDPGLALVDAAEQGGGHGGHDDPEREAERDELCHQRQVCRRSVRDQQSREAGRHQQRRTGQHPTRTEGPGEPASQEVCRKHGRRGRQEHQSGAQGGVVLGGPEVEAEDKDQTVEGDVDQEPDR